MMVADAESVQIYLDKLIAKFGKVHQYGDDMSSKSWYSALMSEAKVQPNKLQQAVAQYVLGIMSPDCNRVLLSSPPGSGKSRVMLAAALMALKTNISSTVHLIYPDKHLMKRDLADFKNTFELSSLLKRVHFRVGMNFKPSPKDLLIFDEADIFIFDDPGKFSKFIKTNPCLCLTGTPSNSKLAGIEKTHL